VKQEIKVIGYTVCKAACLVLIGFAIARVFFGYSPFDRSGWSIEKDGTVRYLDYEGTALLGWQEIEEEVYYFSPERDGTMATGWQELEEGRFFFGEDGLMTTGWAELEDGRYYFDEDGVMCSGWLNTETGRYYLSQSGAMQTGWAEIDGETYFFDEDGVIHTGWLEADEEQYYFLEDGTMAVGKVTIDGVDRYFTSTGKYFVLVNPWNQIPEDYEPELVWFDEEYQIDASCRDALKDMIAACESAGYPCKITSTYRTHDYQNSIFQKKVDKLMGQGFTRSDAELETSRSIARPGTSEHQLGLAVDLKNGSGTYDWLAKHSWEYGFILRYPYGETSRTGVYYEPWHFRYTGKELAEELFELGLCVEEYMEMLTENAA